MPQILSASTIEAWEKTGEMALELLENRDKAHGTSLVASGRLARMRERILLNNDVDPDDLKKLEL